MNDKITKGGTGYLEHLPSDYETNKSKNYPLLIFLHGDGQRGNGTTELYKVKQEGIPRLIEAGHNMTFTVNGVDHKFIVIAPQLKIGGKDHWAVEIQKELQEHVLANYRVDKSRIYLTGLSRGGHGTYIGLSETPDIFAAGAVVAGYSNAQSKFIAERRIPVWAFHGTADPQVKRGDGWTEFMRTQWYAKDTLKIDITKDQIWTEYPNLGHNVWDNAYKTDNSLHTPNIYQWLLGYTKAGVVTPPVVEPPVVVPPIVVPPVIVTPTEIKATPSQITIDGKTYEITLTFKLLGK